MKGKKLNTLIVWCLLFTISIGHATEVIVNLNPKKVDPTSPDGYFFFPKNFVKKHNYFQKEYFNPLAVDYISPSMRKMHLTAVIDHKSSSYNTAEFNQALAAQVIDLSYCLQFDPYAFLGLLYDESRFKFRSTSETFAIGLPQLTTAPFREINHQLGFGPPKTMREGNDVLVREKILKCLNNNEEETEAFIDIFRGKSASASRRIVKNWVYKKYTDFEEKKYFMKRILLVGGLYLKILLASQGTYHVESLKKFSALEKYYADESKGRQAIKDYSARVLSYARQFYNYKIDEPVASTP